MNMEGDLTNGEIMQTRSKHRKKNRDRKLPYVFVFAKHPEQNDLAQCALGNGFVFEDVFNLFYCHHGARVMVDGRTEGSAKIEIKECPNSSASPFNHQGTEFAIHDEKKRSDKPHNAICALSEMFFQLVTILNL